MTDQRAGEGAIWIPCEGSGQPPAGRSYLCAMCGSWRPGVGLDGMVTDHQRDDVLARIDRGDFG